MMVETHGRPPLRIAPSILSADFGRIAEEVAAVDAAGADQIHVDVMDGRFVPNLTIGPVVVEAIRRATRKPLDVHLMIVEPERYVEEFARAGASSLTVQYEACPHLHRVLHQIKGTGARAGVALNPHTAPSALQYVLADLDLVLVMSVNPGFGGQKFIPAALEKVSELDRLLIEADLRSKVDIAVDGGVNPARARELISAGANVLVAGTSVFGAKDYRAAIEALRHAGDVPTGV